MARPDLHARITEQILSQLRDGIRPWMRPWESGEDGAFAGAGLPLRDTGDAYGGINVLVLWAAAVSKGYTKPTWMTFKQAMKHGGRVRKGETAETVVYASQHTKKTEDSETGEERRRRVGFLKRFHVFNVEQIDGLDERWHRSYAEIHPLNRDRRREGLDRFFDSLGIDVRHGGDEAYYVMADDYIQMPRYELFHDAGAYYTTLAHESVHWTRHASRLNRTFRGSYQVPYAKEELVAEIGSAFLAAELGIAPAIREDHADYIGAWLRILEDDNKAIFRAASHASKAVTWLRQKSRAVTADLFAGIDAGESRVREAQPALPLETETIPAWPVRGVGPDAVQGELFRAPPEAPAAEAARRLVAEAEAWRAGDGGVEEARRLLAAADRLDLGMPGVAEAVAAAAVLNGAPGRAVRDGSVVTADTWLEEFREEAGRGLEDAHAADWQIHAGGRGASF